MRSPATALPVLALVLPTLGCSSTDSARDRAAATPPNIVFVFADDLGYADLGVYGSTTIETPHLDALAAAGVRFTRFYSASSVCSPSRASLLTGRYPARIPMDPRAVFFEDSEGGMPPSEVTIAEVLRDRGYATAIVGKWHLGHHPEFVPTAQGFDRHFGLPYSNDMHTPHERGEPAPDNPGFECVLDPACQPRVPVLDDGEVVEAPADQETLTERYTERALEFIRDAVEREQPFFLYYPTHIPHVPLYASERFRGTSQAGIYGDVVAELDDSVGQIVAELDDLGVGEDTLVAFTSDNGPWLLWEGTDPVQGGLDSGSTGPLRQGKGTTFEGGLRVPMIVRWPAAIEPRVEDHPASMLDWMPTLAKAAGASLPDGVELDGRDIGPLLSNGTPLADPFQFLVYRGFAHYEVGGYIEDETKLKLAVVGQEAPYAVYDHDDLLFDLVADPGEANDLAGARPDDVERLRQTLRALEAEVEVLRE